MTNTKNIFVLDCINKYGTLFYKGEKFEIDLSHHGKDGFEKIVLSNGEEKNTNFFFI